MKNLFLSLAFVLTSFVTFANTKELETSIIEEKPTSECCSVTVTNESNGESATVRSCATTYQAACDRAYSKAVIAAAD